MAPRRISSIHPATATVLIAVLVSVEGFVVLRLPLLWPGLHARIVAVIVSFVVALVLVEITVRTRRYRGRQSPRP